VAVLLCRQTFGFREQRRDTSRGIVDATWPGQAPLVWLQKSCAIALPITTNLPLRKSSRV
jgi:hypothetical protein